jgi:putative endonuclease
MWYVYVLKSLNKDKIYTGFTEDFRRRLKEHNAGKVLSTRSLKPVKIVYYEAFLSEEDARAEEKFLKSGYGREVLHNKILKSRSL